MPRKPAHEQFDALKAIREQAFALFGRHGYEGVSIGDIARAARLSKGALYWHYDSKQALYLDCQAQLYALFNDYIFDPMRQERDGVTRILMLFTGLGRLLLDALIVRTILVPAVMHLFGKANWWLPTWMDKILPRMHVEGSGSIPTPAPQEPPEGQHERELEPTGS